MGGPPAEIPHPWFLEAPSPKQCHFRRVFCKSRAKTWEGWLVPVLSPAGAHQACFPSPGVWPRRWVPQVSPGGAPWPGGALSGVLLCIVGYLAASLVTRQYSQSTTKPPPNAAQCTLRGRSPLAENPAPEGLGAFQREGHWGTFPGSVLEPHPRAPGVIINFITEISPFRNIPSRAHLSGGGGTEPTEQPGDSLRTEECGVLKLVINTTVLIQTVAHRDPGQGSQRAGDGQL